jgi:hypothetical protein
MQKAPFGELFVFVPHVNGGSLMKKEPTRGSWKGVI